jgi:hypothetical protein
MDRIEHTFTSDRQSELSSRLVLDCVQTDEAGQGVPLLEPGSRAKVREIE